MHRLILVAVLTKNCFLHFLMMRITILPLHLLVIILLLLCKTLPAFSVLPPTQYKNWNLGRYLVHPLVHFIIAFPCRRNCKVGSYEAVYWFLLVKIALNKDVSVLLVDLGQAHYHMLHTKTIPSLNSMESITRIQKGNSHSRSNFNRCFLTGAHTITAGTTFW